MSRVIRKDPDAGKDWRQKGKGMTEDKMVRWHHQLNEYEFEQALGDGEGREACIGYSLGTSKRIKYTSAQIR